MKKQFTTVELEAIGEKMAKVRKDLLAKGFNPHPRFAYLFRRQIRQLAGVSQAEWEAYDLFCMQKKVEEQERRSLRGRLGRLLGLLFPNRVRVVRIKV